MAVQSRFHDIHIYIYIYVYINVCLHVHCTKLHTHYASPCKLPMTLAYGALYAGCCSEHHFEESPFHLVWPVQQKTDRTMTTTYAYSYRTQEALHWYC